MARVWRLAWVLLLVTGCTRVVRKEAREQPVETGTPVSFTLKEERRWEFGDGATAPKSLTSSHAFSKAGRYEVKAFDGDALTDVISVLVEPRSALHALPPKMEWALIARTLDDVGLATDAFERISSADRVQRFLDKVPLLSFAMEQGAGGGSVVDPLEGAGVGSLDGEVLLSFLGVVDEAAALEAAKAWLVRDGWQAADGRFTKNDRSMALLTHRGTLYGLMGDAAGFGAARSVILEAPALGLEGAQHRALSELSAGGLVLVATNGVTPALWQTFCGTMRVHDRQFEVDGFLVAAKGPLWETPVLTNARLLTKAPENPVAVFSSSAPIGVLLSLMLGPDADKRAKRFDKLVGFSGAKYQAVEAALGPNVDVAAYFDTAGFLRAMVESEGQPKPRGTLVAQFDHHDRQTIDTLVQGSFRLLPFPMTRSNEGGVAAIQTNIFGQGVDLAVGPTALFATVGSPLKREAVDLLAPLQAELDGAFSAGHISAFLDVGRLKQELETPVFVKGVDPRRIVAAQAVSSTYLKDLTTIERLIVDAAPHPLGARVRAKLTASPKEKKPRAE